LSRLDPSVRFELFTTVPRWFFTDSLSKDFGYHPFPTDIGFVQLDPLQIDLEETCKRLDRFFPIKDTTVGPLVDLVRKWHCRLIICDISPLGISVGREAGMPSLLVENFTWDWLYAGYVKADERIGKHIPYLGALFGTVDYHIQTEPVCLPGNPDLTTSPVSRQRRCPRRDIRKKLEIPEGTKVVMITMGGIPQHYPFLDRLTGHRNIVFIIPGASRETRIEGNLRLLPHHSGFFHPDLVHASDAVVGKVGYSTLAEIYNAGVAFGYISRKKFRESKVLVSFIETKMNGISIDEDFHNGRWLDRLPDLLAFPRIQRQGPNGAIQAAQFIQGLLDSLAG
jgi:hypothetical protein